MWDMKPRKILVAVESAECDAALELAAQEARRRRCGVHLMHVMHPVYVGSTLDTTVILAGQLQRLGATIVGDAAAKLEHLIIDDDDLTVSTELRHGAVVPTLVAESVHACLVIMQHHGMGPEGGTPVMSTVNGVAARAHVPVVAVPSAWRPDREAVPVVTVGVEDVHISAEVVRVALEEADRSDARLRLVHLHYPWPTGDADRDTEAANEESRRLEAELSEAFAGVLSSYPEVPADVLVLQACPAEGLVEQASESTLLVVGRRHPRLPIRSHLGPVARAVLRWSPIPVMVVDPVASEGTIPQAPGLATATNP